MATFLYQTKGNANPKGKPRVYFTCHPDDFEAYFGKICEDIFKTHDCAVFYTENLSEEIEEKYLESDLGQMNLFVIPVTFKLLSQPNRAMDSDFSYAKAKHIPVLPVMMESGLDAVYSRADKFGELQYLNPCAHDLTAITYEEKLKKHLESVLIDHDTVERIRRAFDAYIFLSYRKKDRHYANELMKLIHAHPEFQDVAIWYDEFLTPGESFRESIGKMMRDSKLFALLVTPNLLEEPNGKPNFVMAEEYPTARAKGMTVIPAEMVKTNHFRLKRKYKGLKGFLDPYDKELLYIRLTNALQSLRSYKHDNSSEHRYLIGLAYLDGIDVETNVERGIKLITSAAESYHEEAMSKLFTLYTEGLRVTANYQKALIWAKRIAEYYIEEYGEENSQTLTSINNLTFAYHKSGDLQKAVECGEKAYLLGCKILGEEHPNTVTILNNLASTYIQLGYHQKALECGEKAYLLGCKILGEEHPNAVKMRGNLAHIYGKLGDHRKELELQEKVYDLRCKILGEEHPDTLTILSNLACTYGELGDYRKALEQGEKAYALQCKILGAEHPDTLTTLNNLAWIYGELGDHRKELELQEKVYDLRCKSLSEKHPDTLTTLSNLACTYGELGDHRKELELQEKVYDLRCKTLGNEHPDTLNTLNNLANIYGQHGDCHRALEQGTKAYNLHCKILGEEHPRTLIALNNLAYIYYRLGDSQKAVELQKNAYLLRKKVLGEEHPKTVEAYTLLHVYIGKQKSEK